MVQFCTNCGTKLEEDALFCINCGTKVYGFDNKSKKSLVKIKQDDREKKKAKKELKRICGGFIYNKTFTDKLLENGLDVSNTEDIIKKQEKIKKQVKKEIISGQIKSNDVENRVNELIIEYKNIAEKEKQEKSIIIDKLFESEEIQSEIKEYDFSESQVNSIKSRAQNIEIIDKTENAIEGEIKHNIIKELEKEIPENKLKERKNKENDFRNNRINYLESIIKESCPNMKLTTFEEKYVDELNLNGLSIYEMKEKLNKTAKEIINNHKKVGKYDFACMLIEKGGFTTQGWISGRKVIKAEDKSYYVFIKIFENKIKIVGSKVNPPFWITRSDLTIFFKDIINISYNDNGINLNLSNKKKFVFFRDSNSPIKSFEKFYKSWENFKNNENKSNSSVNKKEEVSTADELMKYAELYEKGLLTEEEFNTAKKKLLGL